MTYWNIVKNFPGGISIWSPNHLWKSVDILESGSMSSNSPGNNGIVHHWLVRFILEVAVPSTSEMRGWPRVHLLQFLLSRANLHTSVNAIGSKWASALEVPLIKDSLLNFRHASSEVVETLSV